ncbi:MAG: hypothetical protein AAB019_00370 [Planctomycetota bacterium]
MKPRLIKRSFYLTGLLWGISLYLGFCLLGGPALLPAQDNSSGQTEKSTSGQKVQINGKHGLEITMPEKWTTRQKDFIFSIEGTILELQKELNVGGVLGFQENDVGLELKFFADAFISGVKSASNNFEELGESTLAWGGIRRDCRGEANDAEIHYAVCFFQKNRKVYFLAVWTAESEWNQYKNNIANIFNSVTFTTNPWNIEPPDEILNNKKILDVDPLIEEPPIVIEDSDHVETPYDEDEKQAIMTDDETYRSNRWKFEINLPKDWKMTILKENKTGKVAEFYDKNGSIGGLIMTENWEGDCDEYLDKVLDNIKSEFETEVINESGGQSEATLTYTALIDKVKHQYYSRVIDVSGVKLRFTAWTKAKFYQKYQDTLEKYALTLKGW